MLTDLKFNQDPTDPKIKMGSYSMPTELQGKNKIQPMPTDPRVKTGSNQCPLTPGLKWDPTNAHWPQG